jgi:hypothetical protein
MSNRVPVASPIVTPACPIPAIATHRSEVCMKKLVLVGCILALFGLVPARAQQQSSSSAKATIQFDRDIRPILAGHCLECHGPSKPKAGLNLTDRDSALAKSKSGALAIVPGRPDESELILRVTSTDPEARMPPREKEPLQPAEIDKLRRWIAEGAHWSGHWAYQPLQQVGPPSVRDASWTRNNIDRFVLARLESVGIAASPEADRYTLIKRLHYDLLGLPPTPEAADAFAHDASADAYEKLVDRLLQSPHFGERWGRHWLDLARFADSDGFEKDRARPDAYVYRDWVVDAINADLPFDQFTIEQLAGDLLPGATGRQRIAAAFNRQTLTNEEGGVDQEEFRVAAAFDRTETLGTVWLGLTIGCVRCHEHKYDPLPHADYYKLFAFFNNAEEVTATVPVQADDIAALERELAPLQQALAARRAELAPQELAWETEQHRRILAETNSPLQEHPIDVAKIESLAGQSFRIEKDAVVATAPEKDTYTVTARASIPEITGFKLWVLPDDSLPGKGPGRSRDGNLVLTGFRVFLVREGRPDQPIELHRAAADYAQKGFAPDRVLQADPTGQSGWAVGGKTGQAHWIQFRTRGPVAVGQGTYTLRFELAQQYGSHHTIGRFRLAALTGNARGLHIDRKEIADALEMYPEKRIAATRRAVFDYYVDAIIRDERIAALEKQISAVQSRHKARTMEVRTMGTPLLPRQTQVFARGDFLAPADVVRPGVPGILPPLQSRAADADRLDLARWVVSPGNFLTPRVAVNHVWLHLFGAGLVRTPNDLGVRGEPPTHPELLDWLAAQFRGELGWSRKALIRLIVTSAAYRQSSHFRPALAERDPDNALLARQNRFRVESEIVRDLHLAVSGLLSPKIGGPSVFPPMPEDLAKLSYANSFSWTNSAGEDRYRRGMYTFFKRTIPHPNQMTFDAPDANVACVARTLSNTPLQALTLLNNESHVEAAQALARRLLERPAPPPAVASGTAGQTPRLPAGSEPGPAATAPDSATLPAANGDVDRLCFALRLCVARPPRSEEVSALQQVLASSRQYYAAHAAEAALLIGKPTPKGVAPAEAAAWVATVRVILNLDEFMTRE